MVKKIISILILVVLSMLAVPAFAGAAPTVTIGSTQAEPGTTVEIPVVLSGNTGFSSLGIEIEYDSTAMTLTNAAANSDTGAVFTKARSYDVIPYNMSWDCAGSSSFNGTLVTLTFEIITDVKGDYSIAVDYYKGRNGNYVDGNHVNYDESFEPLGLRYADGVITVGGNKAVQPPAISVGNAAGKPGGRVEIPVVLSDNRGFSSLGIEIEYDKTALKLVNAAENIEVGAAFTAAQTYDIYPYNMSWDCAGSCSFNGTLVTLTFEIVTSAEGAYPVTVDYYKGRNGNYVDGSHVNYDESFVPLRLVYYGGYVTAEEPRGIYLDVTLGEDADSGRVVAGVYDENGRLITTKIYPASETVRVEFDEDITGSYVKVMWWADNLKPLSEAFVKVLN